MKKRMIKPGDGYDYTFFWEYYGEYEAYIGVISTRCRTALVFSKNLLSINPMEVQGNLSSLLNIEPEVAAIIYNFIKTEIFGENIPSVPKFSPNIDTSEREEKEFNLAEYQNRKRKEMLEGLQGKRIERKP